MLTYTNYRTATEFEAGYANSIDAAVVDRWERFFREESRLNRLWSMYVVPGRAPER